MPKTKQDIGERVGYKMKKMKKDTDRIMDESPPSESKEQMKEKLYRRERMTMGDKPARDSAYWADKPGGNPGMKCGGKVKHKKMARGGGVEIRGKTRGKFV